MDDDDLRRGQPTCHKQFDEATAILAGDGLLTEAFHIMGAAAVRFEGREGVLLEVMGWWRPRPAIRHGGGPDA